MTGQTPSDPRSIMIIGLRGIPDVQGGIEAHVAALAPRLARRGWDIEVLARRAHLRPGSPRRWNGVRVTPLWAPRSRYLEALIHTALGVLLAARRRPDIVHIHAIGPALLAPLARLLGLRVVITHHGFDYERQKWGFFARVALRLGERVGMTCADARIAIARAIADSVADRIGTPVTFIPNGVEIHPPQQGITHLRAFGLAPGRYVLSVARIVEEKRQLDLIAAFRELNDPTLKLAIVGSAEHGGAYRDAVAAAAAATPGVVLTGFQAGEALAQLYAHAALFVLPSSHEGMPIALLEALGYGLPVLASDIPANRAIGLSPADHVPVGNIGAWASAMEAKLAPRAEAARAGERARAAEIEAAFGWDRIADQTAAVYAAVVAGSRIVVDAGPRDRPETGDAGLRDAIKPAAERATG